MPCSFGQEGVREATSRRTQRENNIFVLFVFLFSSAWHCAWHIEHAYQCCRKEKGSKRERRGGGVKPKVRGKESREGRRKGRRRQDELVG